MPPITPFEQQELDASRKTTLELAEQLTDAELGAILRHSLQTDLTDYRPSTIDAPLLWLPVVLLRGRMRAAIRDRKEDTT